MIISNRTTGFKELFVWVWLPDAKKPVVAGRLRLSSKGYEFIYGRSYFEQPHAFSLDPQILPLKHTSFGPQVSLFNSLRDASPDAWGRRVLLYRLGMSTNTDTQTLTELDYLLYGGDNRIGALHFQTTTEHYIAPTISTATLEELYQAAETINQGQSISTHLLEALQHGTSIGGARPKATINLNQEAWIAKFSTQTDTFPVVRQEALGMELARRMKINTAESRLHHIMKKDMLLVRRFDRESNSTTQHRHMISGLTALQLDEMEARYASYSDLAAFLWKYGKTPKKQCEELYRRMILNILIGNTDDHARNHSFFWNGQEAKLTPAYDISVLSRIGEEASQAMIIGQKGTFSSRTNALSRCEAFGLEQHTANQLFDELVAGIHTHWHSACDLAELTQAERQQLWRRAVLSPTVLL